jgi:small-conductance mechanosensitive channel
MSVTAARRGAGLARAAGLAAALAASGPAASQLPPAPLAPAAFAPVAVATAVAATAAPGAAATEAAGVGAGGLASSVAGPAPANSPSSTLRRELDALRAELAALAALAPATGDAGASIEARKRAANRLAALLEARLADAEAPAVQAATPVPLALATPPPHEVADLDRLRDQLDGLEAQRAALKPLGASLDGELETAAASRRRAAETLRLRQEQLERARGGDEAGRAREALQLARLEARVAELELARADAARAALRDRLGALAGPIAALQERIGQARGRQRIDEATLARVRDEVEAARRDIARERAAIESALAARGRRPGRDDAPGATGADTVAGPLRDTLASLAELDAVERGRVDVWEQRRTALASVADATARGAAADGLARSVEQATAHERAVTERAVLVRTEAGLLRARVQSTPVGAPERGALQETVAAIDRRVEVDERLRARLREYAVLLERTRADLALAAPAGAPAGLLERTRAALLGALERIWHYELFSATETVQLDGRAVTLAYGVTVGKSLGVLVLFALGAWLAAALTRRIVDALVARGRVSAQLGRVLRRWVMTVLLLAVLIGVLKLARVPLAAFAFLGGALAIGVGFGTQNLIKNLISGVIILFERKVRVGDIVTIGGVTGTVSAVDLRATTVRGFDGIESILPNSHLLENLVADWSHGARTIRSTILVPVAYGADVALAADRIGACARAHPSVLADPPPEVLLDEFAPNGPTLKLWYWVRLGGPKAGPTVASDLRFAIERVLREEAIDPARVRVDVRMRGA